MLWGYTSFMYNWLNIGGGVGDIDFWDSMREAVPYVALLFWVVISGGVIALRNYFGSSRLVQRLICTSVTAVGPVSLIVSDWYFHRGFPVSPV